MPHLQELYHRYRDQGMKMVAINIFPHQDEMVPEWMKEKGFDFPVLVGADQEQIMDRYKFRATPTTLLADPERRLVLRIDGVPDDSIQRLEAVIRERLNLTVPSPASSH